MFNRAVICGVGAFLMVPALLDAQAPTSDPIRELLSEVRALRLTIERAASAGTRIQLLMARVQLQERRIVGIEARIDQLRDAVAKVDLDISSLATRIRASPPLLERIADPRKREELERELEALKSREQAAVERRQQLASEEGVLIQRLNEEQGRWADFNERLEQLERSLVQKDQ